MLLRGKTYCVPYYASARLAVYNKDMLKAGTGSDALPQTEDEFLAAMDKVDAELGKKDKRAPPSTSRAVTGTPRCPTSPPTVAR